MSFNLLIRTRILFHLLLWSLDLAIAVRVIFHVYVRHYISSFGEDFIQCIMHTLRLVVC